MTTRTNQVSNETLLARRPTLTSREPILLSLLIMDFVLFASGAIAHMGIPIPLGFGTWNETFLVPAAIVEGVGALVLGSTLASMWAGSIWSRRLVGPLVLLCWCPVGHDPFGNWLDSRSSHEE